MLYNRKGLLIAQEKTPPTPLEYGNQNLKTVIDVGVLPVRMVFQSVHRRRTF